jgi:hypothetical protein
MSAKTDALWAEVGSIPQKNGLLQREDVLRYAKANKKSATYAWFDSRGAWDDTAAAEAFRLQLAGTLIRVFYTETTVEGEDEPIKVRVLHSLSSDRTSGGGYRRIGSILRSDAKRQVLITDALAALDAVRKRYEAVKALVPIWEAMDEVARQNTFPGANAKSAAR